MRLILVGLVVVVFVFNPVLSPAAAWGQTGHRVTAAIAQAHLGPAARAEIADVLGSETLVEASTWPDFMRSDWIVPGVGDAGASSDLAKARVPSGR